MMAQGVDFTREEVPFFIGWVDATNCKNPFSTERIETIECVSAPLDPGPLPEQYESNCPYYSQEPEGSFAPKFRFIEEFPDGSIYTGDSFGDWEYIDDDETRSCSMACLCRQHKANISQYFTFVVRKDHDDPQLFIIQFHYDPLFQRLTEILSLSNNVTDGASIHGLALLESYHSLKNLVTSPSHQADPLLPYLNLLVNGLLADHHVFESFGYERLYALGSLTSEHWLEFEYNKMGEDISVIDRGYHANETGKDHGLAIVGEITGSGTSGDENTIRVEPILSSLEEPAKSISRCDKNDFFFTFDDFLKDRTDDESALQHFQEHKVDQNVFDIALWGASGPTRPNDGQFLLQPGTDLDDNDTPLRDMSQKDHEKIVQLLLEHGVDPNNYDAPLWDASKNGHDKIVQLLLEHGADSKKYDYLRVASQNGHEKIVQLLLKHGARPDDYDALRFSSQNGHGRIVQLLLDHGADPNNYDALWDASASGHERIVRLLLKHGADPNNYHALWEASSRDHDGILRLLVDQGINSKSHFLIQSLFGTAEGDPNIAKFLSESALVPDDTSPPQYRDLLVVTALMGNASMVRFLHENWRRLDIDYESMKIIKAAKQGDTNLVWRLFNENNRTRRAKPSQRLVATRLLMKEARSARLSTFYSTFKRSHEKVVQVWEASSKGFHEFTEKLADQQQAWEIGVSTLRSICKGRQPENLEEVIAFLCIAWSMLRTIDEDDYDRSRSTQFRQDLRKWKFLLPEANHSLYKAAVIALCGGYGEEGDDLELNTLPEELRRDLQDMACSLINQSSHLCDFTRFSDESLLSSQERWRLRLTENEETGEIDACQDLDTRLSAEMAHQVDDAGSPNRVDKSNKPRLKDRTSSDTCFIKGDVFLFLVFGAVFILVLQFLLWSRMTSSNMIWSSLTTYQASPATQGNSYDITLKPACTASDRIQLLEKYLGLHTAPRHSPTPQLSAGISFISSPVFSNFSTASTSSENTGGVGATDRSIQKSQHKFRVYVLGKGSDLNATKSALTCGDCGESFSSRTNLLRHQREIHGERKFSCEHCGKFFARKDHQRTHKCRPHSGTSRDRDPAIRKRKADNSLGRESSKKPWS